MSHSSNLTYVFGLLRNRLIKTHLFAQQRGASATFCFECAVYKCDFYHYYHYHQQITKKSQRITAQIYHFVQNSICFLCHERFSTISVNKSINWMLLWSRKRLAHSKRCGWEKIVGELTVTDFNEVWAAVKRSFQKKIAQDKWTRLSRLTCGYTIIRISIVDRLTVTTAVNCFNSLTYIKNCSVVLHCFVDVIRNSFFRQYVNWL